MIENNNRRKRILVLGGTGFIGSEVMNKLRTKLDLYDVALLAHRNVPFQKLEDFNLYTGSLQSLDLDIIDSFKPDCIIHMARISGSGKFGRWMSSRKGFKANQRLVNHLASKHPQTKNLYVSGTLIYGDCGVDLVAEDHDKHPTAFAKEYMYAEEPWRIAQRQGRLDVSMLVPPWIVGPSSWFKQFYLSHMKQLGAIPLLGDGKNWMSILDLEDCAGLIVTAISEANKSRDYNIYASGCQLTMSDFVAEMSSITQLPIKKYSLDEIARKYGKTVVEAFTFSLKSATNHPELMDAYTCQFSTPEMVIKNNLNKAGYFSEV